MIKVLFFGEFQDLLGENGLELPWQNSLQTIRDIREHLIEQDGKFSILKEKTCLCSLNQTMSKLDANVQSGDEVALFPMITGG